MFRTGATSTFKPMPINGSAFCFLPLAIQTMLNYHINGPFCLSEDRLKFYEHSKDDKKSGTNKHDWNLHLREPLTRNLLAMIKYATRYCHMDNIDEIVETFWPLESHLDYFKMFAQKFYEKISDSDSFPFLNEASSVVEFCHLNKCIFVDFFFQDEAIQNTAIELLKKIVNAENKFQLICLPAKYLPRIKEISNANSRQFIAEYALFEKIIHNKKSLDYDQYEIVLLHYLSKKCSSAQKNSIKRTKYSDLVMKNECIPTCDRHFKYVHDLIDRDADLLYADMFERSDDMFPSDHLCRDKAIVKNLSDMGLIGKNLSTHILIGQ